MAYRPTLRFPKLTTDPDMQTKLASAYNTVDDIDAWVGLLVETHQPNALVGPTLVAILKDQFQRLRDGDRFWYEAYLDPASLSFVQHNSRLSDVILRNTTITTELEINVFALQTPIPTATPTPRPTRTRLPPRADAPDSNPNPTRSPTPTPRPTRTPTPTPTPSETPIYPHRRRARRRHRHRARLRHVQTLLPELYWQRNRTDQTFHRANLAPQSRGFQSASQMESCCCRPCVVTRHQGTSASSYWANKTFAEYKGICLNAQSRDLFAGAAATQPRTLGAHLIPCQSVSADNQT